LHLSADFLFLKKQILCARTKSENHKKQKTMASATQTHPDPPPGASPAFIPLEANPELMTTLLHRLGLSSALQVHDVYSISEPELLAFIPRPALALLLVFPVSAVYESQRMAEDAPLPAYDGKGPGEPVVWFRQTIRNACGLMGLLHAVSNGPAREYIGKFLDAPPSADMQVT
jgi:ubiquitin carboxyl-terminal hydrolase L3